MSSIARQQIVSCIKGNYQDNSIVILTDGNLAYRAFNDQKSIIKILPLSDLNRRPKRIDVQRSMDQYEFSIDYKGNRLIHNAPGGYTPIAFDLQTGELTTRLPVYDNWSKPPEGLKLRPTLTIDGIATKYVVRYANHPYYAVEYKDGVQTCSGLLIFTGQSEQWTYKLLPLELPDGMCLVFVSGMPQRGPFFLAADRRITKYYLFYLERDGSALTYLSEFDSVRGITCKETECLIAQGYSDCLVITRIRVN